MIRVRFWIVGCCALLAAASPAVAGGKDADAWPEAKALAARIDHHLAAGWSANNVEPALPADDAEFLRRVYLDVAGRIPAVSEARAFLADSRPDKRQRLVDRLLDSPAYVNNFTNVWRTLMLPEADLDFQIRFTVPAFEAWLRKHFAENTRYDGMVRELLTAKVGGDNRRFYNPYDENRDANPVAYYLAKGAKPENLAASTARLFLGIHLECAQCHNHPFAHWSRNQFWEYAAFFAGFDNQGRNDVFGLRELPDRRELPVVGTGQVVQATFLDGTEPQFKYKSNSRGTLADWMTRADNPFFARAAANRMWGYFFGTGIVDPVDDLSDEHKPSHPELLDEMARAFAEGGFDFKFLVRAITASRAYQLSSRATHPGQDDPRLFARMALKGLSPEQLFDSLSLATGYLDTSKLDRNPFIFNQNSPRTEFLQKFINQDKRTEYQTSILQALQLMNGKFIAEQTSLDRSATLAAVNDAPFLDPAGKVETLYLATFSRKPRPEEADRLVKYVTEGGPKKNPKAALADVFWALLNSSEFMLNH